MDTVAAEFNLIQLINSSSRVKVKLESPEGFFLEQQCTLEDFLQVLLGKQFHRSIHGCGRDFVSYTFYNTEKHHE